MSIEQKIYKGIPCYSIYTNKAPDQQEQNGDAGEKQMPLMNKIMKKYEQEAQEKILEAQQLKKEKRQEEYDGKDGAEILHDPYSDEEEDESVEIDIENNGNDTEEINNVETQGKVMDSKELIKNNETDEEVIETKNEIEKLCKSLQKANQALEKIKEKEHVLEKVKEMNKEEIQETEAMQKQKIEI